MTTNENRTGPYDFADLLREIVSESRDGASVARHIGLDPRHFSEWLGHTKPNSFARVAMIVEKLRENGNARADDLFLAVSRRLGFVAYRQNAAASDDVDFAGVLREFADVVDARTAAERDGHIDPTERRNIARRAAEAAEQFRAYSDKQNAIADAEEKQSATNVRSIR